MFVCLETYREEAYYMKFVAGSIESLQVYVRKSREINKLCGLRTHDIDTL